MDFSQYDHGDFFRLWLARMLLPITPPNLMACAAVSIFESSQGNEVWNNPFACEQPWKRAKRYNEAGVRIYRTVEDGVNATATMYSQPVWHPVIHALASASGTRKDACDAWQQVYAWADHPNFYRLFRNPALIDRLNHPLQPVG